MKERITTSLEVAGALLIVIGIALVAVPAALIVAGLALIAISWKLSR